MKIYIIPSGWDRELVLKTVFKSGADKVCLLSAYPKKKHTYSESDHITEAVNDDVVLQLKKFTDVDVLKVNYIDLKDIVIQVTKYIREHPDDEFVVNIATGSHLLCGTLMLVAFMNNIDIEYSIAKNHNPRIMQLIKEGENYHCGFTKVLRLPSIPFHLKLSTNERAILKHLKTKKTMTVKDFVIGAKGNDENRRRSSFHYACKKLERQGMVSLRTKGKQTLVSLTPLGEIWTT